MRPHRLRVTAFGAFGGTVEVSFDDLARSGLFLLHGETGAGKTTLLDAIGFALYGRAPGERGKARRLRSDHAAPGTSTEVQLEATLGGRRMRALYFTRATAPHGDGPRYHHIGLYAYRRAALERFVKLPPTRPGPALDDPRLMTQD